ncbi:MAG: 16S rRNA (guanine(966)-N(2))-methyltransferase RsmD [Nitrospirota bacterium]
MRISGGTVKGRRTATQRLFKKVSTAPRLRPTTSKVREAIFDILRNKIKGASFVDLYAGTGMVGFEALSRGSGKVVFVELNKSLVREIEKIARHLGFQERMRVINTRAEKFLRKAAARKERFDILFVDPPYFSEELEKVLPLASDVIDNDGLVIAEHFFKKSLPEKTDNLILQKSYRYGDSVLTLYKRKSSNEKDSNLSRDF